MPEEVVKFLEKNINRIQERYPEITFGAHHEISKIRVLASELPLEKGGRGDLAPFREYSKNNKDNARKLRNEMTEAEKKLWLFLRSQEETWNRQKPIDNFIVDFYCSKYCLVIEVD